MKEQNEMCPRDFTEEDASPKTLNSRQAVPFRDAEEAWFWFIAAQAARNDGARFVAGAGLYPRPCEPLDILKVLDRLYRQRRLLRDHLLVLRHYGRRHMSPDPRRVKEQRAHKLWHEALERIESVLQDKGIVRKASNWLGDKSIFNANDAREVAAE